MSWPALPASATRDLVEEQRAGEAVDQRAAVEEDARGQRAQDEVFEPGLGRAQRIAVERRQHIERQALQLDRHVEGEQAVGRDHHRHAEGREQGQDRVLEPVDALVGHVAARHHDGDARAGEDHHLEEGGVAVEDEVAAQAHDAGLVLAQHHQRRHDQRQARERGEDAGRLLVAEGSEQEKPQARNEEEDLAQRRRQVERHGLAPSLSAVPGDRGRHPRSGSEDGRPRA